MALLRFLRAPPDTPALQYSPDTAQNSENIRLIQGSNQAHAIPNIETSAAPREQPQQSPTPTFFTAPNARRNLGIPVLPVYNTPQEAAAGEDAEVLPDAEPDSLGQERAAAALPTYMANSNRSTTTAMYGAQGPAMNEGSGPQIDRPHMQETQSAVETLGIVTRDGVAENTDRFTRLANSGGDLNSETTGGGTAAGTSRLQTPSGVGAPRPDSAHVPERRVDGSRELARDSDDRPSELVRELEALFEGGRMNIGRDLEAVNQFSVRQSGDLHPNAGEFRGTRETTTTATVTGSTRPAPSRAAGNHRRQVPLSPRVAPPISATSMRLELIVPSRIPNPWEISGCLSTRSCHTVVMHSGKKVFNGSEWRLNVYVKNSGSVRGSGASENPDVSLSSVGGTLSETRILAVYLECVGPGSGAAQGSAEDAGWSAGEIKFIITVSGGGLESEREFCHEFCGTGAKGHDWGSKGFEVGGGESKVVLVMAVPKTVVTLEKTVMKIVPDGDGCVCQICMDGKVQNAIVPCGHCFCSECTKRMLDVKPRTARRCGMCRGKVKSSMRIYL